MAMDPLDEIRRLYFQTTRATVARDLERAVALLKTLESAEERERAAVYMDGLSEMGREWAVAGRSRRRRPTARGGGHGG